MCVPPDIATGDVVEAMRATCASASMTRQNLDGFTGPPDRGVSVPDGRCGPRVLRRLLSGKLHQRLKVQTAGNAETPSGIADIPDLPLAQPGREWRSAEGSW